ncbi:MAG: alkaline phosphatase [Verrucomicrobiales bacterium]|nr:alkaline phosphatase [Verrucomicrobiales bacterium]
MKLDPPSFEIARRDWLKTATLGGALALLGRGQTFAEAEKPVSQKVRGVVFMVADGMSPGVMTLAQAYSQLTRSRGTRWWELFNHPMAARGLMDTASANSMVTDSAAASSSWGCGQRVNNGSINVAPGGNALPPIAALLKQKRHANIGLVTTATVTHATPAGFAASVTSRGDENNVALQYLDRVDILLGGGSGYFDAAKRPDKRDLRGDFVKIGYQSIATRSELLASKSKRLLGTFTAGHLPYSIDRDHDQTLSTSVPTLTEMAEAALSRFLEDNKPFLLQVEGARVDHAAHLNDIAGLLGEQLAFDDAIAAVQKRLEGRDDVLVVVTSDHGNSNPGLNGTGVSYMESTPRFQRITRAKASHERIFSEWLKLKSSDPAQLTAHIASYLDIKLKADEADALLKILARQNVIEWSHQLDKPEGLLGQFEGNHTGIGWTGTSHTSDATLVTAIGPQASRFSGMVRNSHVFGHLMEMLG